MEGTHIKFLLSRRNLTIKLHQNNFPSQLQFTHTGCVLRRLMMKHNQKVCPILTFDFFFSLSFFLSFLLTFSHLPFPVLFAFCTLICITYISSSFHHLQDTSSLPPVHWAQVTHIFFYPFSCHKLTHGFIDSQTNTYNSLTLSSFFWEVA